MINSTPKHLAIIMDGNNRWAKQKKISCTKGHLEGTKTVKIILEEAVRLGIHYLTLYTFSSENWKRPQWEVNALMKLFVQKIEEELPSLNKNQVRLRFIGDFSKLSSTTKEKLQSATQETLHNTGIQLILAISYGSRQEIVTACQTIVQKVQQGQMDIKDINEDSFSKYLYAPDVPDPNLLIRTGGFHRLSNYLLWQLAYTELYTTPILWPDFNQQNLKEAIEFYQNVERKFGKSQQTNSLME